MAPRRRSAQDAYQWAEAQGRIVGQLLEELATQVGQALEDAFTGHAQRTEQWRRHAAEDAASQSAREPQALPGDASHPNLPWKGLGHAPDGWWAITQRWLDTVNTAAIQRART